MINVDPIGTQSDNLLVQDYGCVELRIVYAKLPDGTFWLIFGIGKLLPKEYPLPTSWPLDQKDKTKGVWQTKLGTLYYRKLVYDSVTDFITWWNTGVTQKLTIPDPKNPDLNIPLETFGLVLEPASGNWNLSTTWPYIGTHTLDHVYTTRTKHLFPTIKHPTKSKLLDLLLIPKVSEGLTALLGKQLVHLNEFWLGSLHLEAQNPLYRFSTQKRCEDGNDEHINCEFTLRHGQNLNGLVAVSVEKRPSGLGQAHVLSLDKDTYLLRRKGVSDQMIFAVYCPLRGLLEASGPLSWLREINMTSHMMSGSAVEIVVPASGVDKEEAIEISAPNHPLNSTTIIGKPVPNSVIPQMRNHFFNLRRLHQAQELGQRTFYKNREEAKKYVRGIIARAEKRIWFIDPYFAIFDFFRFIGKANTTNAEIKLVTSAEHLKHLNRSNIFEHDRLLDPLQPFDQTISEKELQLLERSGEIFSNQDLQYVVITGEPCPIHDRYIVIDDDLWQIGSSFNSFGTSLSSITKLIDSQKTIDSISEIIQDRGVALQEWNKSWRNNNQDLLNGARNV